MIQEIVQYTFTILSTSAIRLIFESMIGTFYSKPCSDAAILRSSVALKVSKRKIVVSISANALIDTFFYILKLCGVFSFSRICSDISRNWDNVNVSWFDLFFILMIFLYHGKVSRLEWYMCKYGSGDVVNYLNIKVLWRMNCRNRY